MNLRHLNIFKTVCEEGGFTNAAKSLSMTQPAVSHAITELEDSLGTKLFDRTSRKIILNEPGHLFFAKVLPFLDLYEDLEKYAQNLDRQSGIRIGASTTVASYLLPSVIKKFKQTHFDTPVTVSISSAKIIEDKLSANEIDIALIEGAITGQTLEKIPFSAYPLAVVCAPDHPLALSMGPIPLDQIAGEPLFLPDKGNAVRDTVDSALLLQNLSVLPVWTSSDCRPLIEAVKQGLGLSILPRILVEQEMKTGQLTEIDIQGAELSCVNHVVFKKDKFQTEGFQSFINFVLFQ